MSDKYPVYPQSRELKGFIESHDWTLYRVNRLTGEAFKWEELEIDKSAEEFELGDHYIFVPIPKSGQSIREAYSVTQGLGPSLSIEDPSYEGWDEVIFGKSCIRHERLIFFSRLWFPNERVAVVISPKTKVNYDPDTAGIKLPYLLDAFEKYFRIVTPEEVGLTSFEESLNFTGRS